MSIRKAHRIVRATGLAEQALESMLEHSMSRMEAGNHTTPRKALASGESPLGIAFSALLSVPGRSTSVKAREAAGSPSGTSTKLAEHSFVHVAGEGR